MPVRQRLPSTQPTGQPMVGKSGMVEPLWRDFFMGLSDAQFLPQTELTSGAATGQYLVVFIRGTRYKIALLADA